VVEIEAADHTASHLLLSQQDTFFGNRNNGGKKTNRPVFRKKLRRGVVLPCWLWCNDGMSWQGMASCMHAMQKHAMEIQSSPIPIQKY